MAIHTLRVQLDDEIMEHRVILDRMEGMSGLARAEYLRLHLFRSVMDVEKQLRSATRQVEELQAGINARRKRVSGSAKPRAARAGQVSAAPVAAETPAPRPPPPLQPFKTV